ncbi:hypothetical protein [Paraburkholderia sp.]|uniref:hypothetical protein n=1 Tax=Paraburkholderia sp. TaxID=1926495 RepID=UPI00286F3718|nr:hypothetical protein [Paraburkholderia sp.]
MVENKDILEWCYVVGTLQFGVFGFLYSVFATAALAKGPRPPITVYLRQFCRVIAITLLALTLTAGVGTYNAWLALGLTFAGVALWIILASLALVTGYSLILAFWKMGYTDSTG